MKRLLATIGKYSLIPLCICLFGIFIYPTMYKYDKLDQKYPVQINRITGETKVLTANGWEKADDYNKAANEMYDYKVAITKQIDAQNERIKNEVIEEIKSQIEEIKNNVLSSEMTSGALYDTDSEQLNPAATKADSFYEGFTKGDTPERVKEIMGTPDSIMEVGPFETWGYGLSTIKFENGKVTGWDNIENNLLLE